MVSYYVCTVLLLVQNSTSNTKALINGIGFNSGVAMLATRNKIVYIPNGIVTIYLKLVLLLWNWL